MDITDSLWTIKIIWPSSQFFVPWRAKPPRKWPIANGHLLYVRCPIHTAERQWTRICEQNNTKLGCYVARNEARARKAETFSNSKISWKIQLRCSRHAGCFGCPTTTRKPCLKDYGLSKVRKTELCIQASRQALMRLCLERRRGSDLEILRSQTACTLLKKWNSSLTLKRPPGVKFDPSLRFFDNFFGESYSDTNLRDFVTTSVL